VLQPAPIGVEFAARDETGPNAACDGPKLTFADQGADVLLGTAELGGKVSNRQAIRLFHAGSIACGTRDAHR
jgi:hypothetical protein